MTLYRHSGRVPAGGLMFCCLTLVPLALVGGAIYSAAMVYLPLVKLKWFISLLFAGFVGFLIGKVCELGKLRNRGAVVAFALLAMGLTYYIAWGLHPLWVVAGEAGFGPAMEKVGAYGLLPPRMIAWIKHLYENGLWSLGGGGAVKGPFLAVLWLIEAATLFVTSYGIALSTFGFRPFCESCNRWTVPDPNVAELPVSADDPAWDSIRDGHLEALRTLKLDPVEGQFVRIDLAACGDCDASDYMLASAVSVTIDKDGDVTTQETPIVEYLHVSREKSNEIREFAAEMNEAVEIMRTETLDDTDTDADAEPESLSD